MREGDLRAMGCRHVGQNVAVHETCVLIDLEAIRFGNNVRVDPFVVLSAAGGWLRIGDFVHVASHCAIMAGSGVELSDFCGLSSGTRVLSRSDDFGGEFLTGPTLPAMFTAPPAQKPVSFGRHVVIGAGGVVLPESEIGEGVVVGAGSVAKGQLAPWSIYAGAPARRIRDRKRHLLDREAQLKRAMDAGDVVMPVGLL